MENPVKNSSELLSRLGQDAQMRFEKHQRKINKKKRRIRK
jgi:hypothetical protein